jgi:hypothetical protein
MHTLHFRPGSPQIEMPWNWTHDAQVLWRRDEIELELQSDTPQSLAATLWLWVRAGITMEQTGAVRCILPNEIIELQGGAPVVLRSETCAVEIHGLPQSAHRMNIRHESPIPSARARYCGGLCLGLKFPVALQLRFRLS